MVPGLRPLELLSLTRVATGRQDAHEERVVGLFRNRAELKKAYSELQNEIASWKDRHKQQEGALTRAQETLQGLEARLSSIETGLPALVYYQLRELWSCGQSLLATFIADLVAYREAQEREAHERAVAAEVARCNARFGASLIQHQDRAVAASTAVEEIRGLLHRYRAWWHYFRRRSLRQRLELAAASASAAFAALEAEKLQRDSAIAATKLPYLGLSMESRRAVNIAAINYGQTLYERLAVSSVFDLACKANRLREPPEDSYGGRARCEALMGEVQLARATLQEPGRMRDVMAQVARRLKPLYAYASATEVAPDAGALAGNNGTPGTRLLLDNIWQINRLLLR